MSERDKRSGQGVRRASPGVEPLEARALLSGTIADIATLPGSMTAGPMAVVAGSAWFAEQGRAGGPALGVQSASGSRTEVPLPADDAGGTVSGLAADASGNVWYAVDLPAASGGPAGRIGRVSPGGAVAEFPLTTAEDVPGGLTIGPDGNVWAAVTSSPAGPSIDRVSPDGSVAAHPVPGALSVDWLTTGPDKNLWFVDGPRIGKMTTDGAVTKYLVPPASDSNPGRLDLSHAQLTAGPDGNVWFLGRGGLSKITTDGSVSTMPTSGTAITSLQRGGDGNLWISFPAPATGPLAGSPGALVARVAADGSTTLLPDRVDAVGTQVAAMAAGADGSLWLNEGGDTFGRVNLASIPGLTPAVVSPVSLGVLRTKPNGTLLGIVGSFSANYPGASRGDFSVSIDWGDGHVSPGVVEQDSNGHFLILGANRYALPAGTVKTIQFHITGPNGAGATTFEVVSVTGRSTRAHPAKAHAAKAVRADHPPAKAKA